MMAIIEIKMKIDRAFYRHTIFIPICFSTIVDTSIGQKHSNAIFFLPFRVSLAARCDAIHQPQSPCKRVIWIRFAKIKNPQSPKRKAISKKLVSLPCRMKIFSMLSLTRYPIPTVPIISMLALLNLPGKRIAIKQVASLLLQPLATITCLSCTITTVVAFSRSPSKS